MDAEAVVGGLAGTEKVLLLSPTLSEGAERNVCHGLMADRSDELLYVSLVRSVDEIVDEWRRAPVDHLAVVTVETRRGEVANPESATGTHLRAEHVSSPDDLTGIGIAVTQVLEGFEGPAPAVCFNSLTVLLQYTDVEQTFRFLHVLSRYLDEAGASFHAHLDPATQADETLSTLATLFDGMARYEDDEWQVRRQ